MSAQQDLAKMRHRDRALAEDYLWLVDEVGLSREAAARRLGYKHFESLERRAARLRERGEG